MRYALAYLLPEPVASYHCNLSDELAASFRRPPVSERVMPHLTLKAPFETDNPSEIEQISELVRTFAAKETPQAITLSGIGHFDHRVVYFAVAAPKQTFMFIRRLQDKLRDVAWLPFCANEFPITLHATLAFTKHPQQGKAMLAYLGKKRIPEFPLALDRITLLEKPNGRWRERERWTLGG